MANQNSDSLARKDLAAPLSFGCGKHTVARSDGLFPVSFSPFARSPLLALFCKGLTCSTFVGTTSSGVSDRRLDHKSPTEQISILVMGHTAPIHMRLEYPQSEILFPKCERSRLTLTTAFRIHRLEICYSYVARCSIYSDLTYSRSFCSGTQH